MKFTCKEGEIEIKETSVCIRKFSYKGMFNPKKIASPDRNISMSQIVSVNLLSPSKHRAAGCIYIQVVGGKVYSTVSNLTHYATEPNAIIFAREEYDEVLKFKEVLDEALDKYRAQAPAAENQNSGQSDLDNYNKLRELKGLLDDGIISQSDFDKAKARILGI